MEAICWWKLVDEVPIAPHVVDWIVQLVRATRPQDSSVEPIKKYVEWVQESEHRKI